MGRKSYHTYNEATWRRWTEEETSLAQRAYIKKTPRLPANVKDEMDWQININCPYALCTT